MNDLPPTTVAERLVEAFLANGVEYLFLNPGTDTAPLLEALAVRELAALPVPRVVLCAHEAVALSAAHGFYMLSGRPQVVVVHVDVGTQNLGAMLHNVWRSEIGVVIFAGRTPVTTMGDIAGMRDLPVHWQQDVPDQDGIVRPYVKSIVDLGAPEMVEQQVDRLFQLARSVPSGATYLTAGREVLMADATPAMPEYRRQSVPGPYEPNRDSIAAAAQLISASRRPVVTTSRLGRNPDAVGALVEFVTHLGAPVIDRRERMNFPSDHPLYVKGAPAQKAALEQADLVIVIDSDVPWVPKLVNPSVEAKVIHIGTDPLHVESPNWSFPSDLTIQSDPAATLRALNGAVSEFSEETRSPWYGGALPSSPPDAGPDGPMSAREVFEVLDDLLEQSDVVVEEVTTNGDGLRESLNRTIPGTLFQSGGSGLGWSLGASIGAKLAAPTDRVIAIVGDGAFMFNNPSAALWTAKNENTPFLVVVLNNGGYAASRKPIVGLYPDGAYVRSSPVGTQFVAPPDYAAIARASGFEAATVVSRASLRSSVVHAINRVDAGMGYLLEIAVTSEWLPTV